MRSSSHEAMEHLPILPEAIAVGSQSQGPFPTNDLASHHEDRPVRIDRALLVQHFHSDLNRIDDDDRLSKDLDRDEAT